MPKRKEESPFARRVKDVVAVLVLLLMAAALVAQGIRNPRFGRETLAGLGLISIAFAMGWSFVRLNYWYDRYKKEKNGDGQ